MRVTCYPADTFGCGHFRVIWPAEALARQGHDVRVLAPDERDIKLVVNDRDGVEDVLIEPGETDVIVLQRVTHPWLAQAVPILRAKGIAVVVDIDDDLSSINPANPAYESMHPKYTRLPQPRNQRRHSWAYLADACRDATLVTVSTPALLDVYARHGRGRVLYNYLPEHYFGQPHTDSDLIGWPAYLPSHPDDPQVMGGAMARVLADGGQLHVTGIPDGCGTAFGIGADPTGETPPRINEWAAAVNRIGIGVAPLADTKFNRAKSWLKPLEMSALGVPWVASPRIEYSRIHALGAGLLAERPRTWYQKINLLRTNEKARLDLGEAGRAAVRDLRTERQAWRWAEVWAEALRMERAQTRAAARISA